MDIEILMRPRKIEQEMLALQIKYEALEASAERTVSLISLAPGHGQGVSRKLEDFTTQMADISEKMDKKGVELLIAQEKASDILSLLDKPESDILEKRYLSGKTWREISQQLGYTERSCRYYHDIAINKLTNL